MRSSLSTPANSTLPAIKELGPQNLRESLTSLLMVSLWFGIFTGLIEGIGLLLFQRINWMRWGPNIHVAKEIIWISSIVDIIFFATLALIVAGLHRLADRISPIRLLVFALVFFVGYDWLSLTQRVSHHAGELLALGVAVAFDRWFTARRERIFYFWKRSFAWLTAAWCLVLMGIQGGKWLVERQELANLPPAASGAPNVLVIVIDTLRADHLSAYGYSRRTTPNLDRMAREGLLFENAISASSWTLPSHASLVTGRYPSDHRLQNVQPMPWLGWRDKALKGFPTLGEALEKKSYRTAAFSANQGYFTSNVGLGRGFIRFEDYFQSARDMFFRAFFGQEFARIFLHRSDRSLVTRSLRSYWPSLLNGHKEASEVNREALAWIDRGHQPFFAFLNYIDVHDAGSARWQHSESRSDVKGFIEQYDSALTYVDGEIGNLLRQFEKRGLAKNTVLIVTSDHGESLG